MLKVVEQVGERNHIPGITFTNIHQGRLVRTHANRHLVVFFLFFVFFFHRIFFRLVFTKAAHEYKPRGHESRFLQSKSRGLSSEIYGNLVEMASRGSNPLPVPLFSVSGTPQDIAELRDHALASAT